jgi:predicted nucleic acid-binding protein
VGIIVDTDQLIELERGSPRGVALDRIIGDEERAICAISVSELLHGVFRSSGESRTRRLAFVERFLAGVDCLPVDEPAARIHAAVGADLAATGRPIGTHDLWIGATALANGLGVATHNASDFTRIPGLRVLTA